VGVEAIDAYAFEYIEASAITWFAGRSQSGTVAATA
jgi:hypothetical protein